MKRLFLLLFLFASLMAPMKSENVDSRIREKQKELEDIDRQLAESEEKYRYFGQREGSLLQELRKIQDRIESTSRDKASASANMKKLEKDLNGLNSEIEDLEEKKARIDRILGAVVLDSFMTKIRNNASGPSLSSAVKSERSEIMLSKIGGFNYYILKETVDTIILTAQKVDAKNRSFERYRLSYLEKKISEKKLAALEKEESNALGSIRSKKEYYDRIIKELKSRKEELNGLIKNLEKRGSQFSSSVSFAELRGGLIWPASGTIHSSFGKNVDNTYKTVTTNDGIDIKTAPAGPIRAVAGGRVIYAQPFKSFGRMIILDHGDNYYTIYANLSESSVRKGQLVTSNQQLGTAARDPLSGVPLLHFELRHGSEPLSPLSWLSGR